MMRDVNPPGRGGRILNVSSIGGYIGNQSLSFYSAGKFGKIHIFDYVMSLTEISFKALEGFTEAVSKEMLPEWNIKAVIIEPGGFQTEWKGSSMERVPPHPLYAHPTSPTSLFKQMSDNVTYIGDPSRAGKAMMAVASLPNPPARIQLGTESVTMIKMKAQKTIDDAIAYEELSHSTNADGIDKNKVMEGLSQAVKFQ